MDYKKVGILLAIGIIVLVGMVVFIGPTQIIDALKNANMTYVMIAIVLEFITIFLWTLRWSVVSKSLNIPHKTIPLFAMTIVGLALNDLTPSGRSGGEPVRAYLLGKSSSSPFKTTLASVMGDKLFDALPFIVLSIIAIMYLMFYLHLSAALFYTLALSLVFFLFLMGLVIYICLNEAFGLKAIRWVFRQIRRFTSKADKYEDTVTSSLEGFQESLRYILADKKVLIIASVLSFLAWILELLRVYLVFLAFGVHISIGMISAVFMVSSLVGIIPVLPGGLGSIDGVMILLYSMAGITASVSTAATLVERMISLWLVIIVGMIILPFFGTGALDYVDMDS